MNIKNLKFKYPRAKDFVLQGVSFSLHTNKLNAIVGVNGSGKTTMFDCITSVLNPAAGEINLPHMQDILYVTQSLFFSPVIKGKDFANFVRRIDDKPIEKELGYYTKKMSQREKELFEHLWELRIGKMSIGERKWFFIHILIMIDRSLYIFDEPTSGVDPASRKRIYELIGSLIKEGKTCIVSTHQLQDLMYLDSHLIILNKGRITYEGDFKEWLHINNTDNPDEAFENMLISNM
ncbi:ABC transporter ATP-binding protein [Paenibacillus sp. F411]|uniref:ABC transporter n=1 Tax=Paenibacillus algicola TaxID=2565926 RepID=A0A4V1G3U2_9BACL|nr:MULTISPECIES: ABC transporter ATP-binding protein [Paenibacillus]MBO2944990.1 ABC transporter ATP-binding protein [Paenibacillus sp. F411]QCT02384.1 ABC transporter [Paenibacillus algicola]